MVILLTDGQGSYSDYYTQQAINNNITVYTVGLGSGVNSALLTSIATSTGGQYFSVSTAEDLPDVFRTISEEIEPADTDGDGVPDITETTGFRDGFGNWYYTDPENSDTDGDGLPDGEEAGGLAEYDGKKYFQLLSDPTKADSDGDFLSDFEEYELGTNPLSEDTDRDGISDFDDEYPLSPASIEPEPGTLEKGRAIVLGAVFGECGIEGGSLAGFVDSEISSSAYYLVGWIGFSLVPVAGAVADARDAVQALINGDELGAALNAAGAFSGIGDGVKTGAALSLFLVKYPSKLNDVQKVVVPLLKYVPLNQAKKVVLDALFDNAATRLVNKYGEVIIADLIVVAEKNGNLEKTIGVVKSEAGRVVWLEEGITEAEAKVLGKKPAGWKHIFEDHIKSYNSIDGNDFAKKFDPSGSNYRNEESIQNLIHEGVAKGTMDSSTGIYYYDVAPDCDKVLRVVVGSNGYIVTAYPFEKVRVPISL
ncbi:hypothetical protein MSLAZ_0199 [Methanosarcina lacustris Z-7289]|uniref:VWFA domain-containing protein n=1 Tax=Methanosarcina lacustris Z-7289 TaxID=1434111 RepID=A0A0E3WQF2_9EURY|nr:VWA domain-containing protein [Methanosarcina lacustris]AKB73460.1 hypothetical protein MSLAZ_0199 [Methanosarcina lacustris Z-7289]